MHQLPALPYSNDALEPYIDAQTMGIHHDKHHNAYVTNLNKALESHPDLAAKSVEDLLADFASVPEAIQTAVRNHGGGHANHSLFWTVMGPGGGGEPGGELASAIAGSSARSSARSSSQVGYATSPPSSRSFFSASRRTSRSVLSFASDRNISSGSPPGRSTRPQP